MQVDSKTVALITAGGCGDTRMYILKRLGGSTQGMRDRYPYAFLLHSLTWTESRHQECKIMQTQLVKLSHRLQQTLRPSGAGRPTLTKL